MGNTAGGWVAFRSLLLRIAGVACVLGWAAFAHAADDECSDEPDPCAHNCFVIEHMVIEGDLTSPPLRFNLQGHVLSPEPQLVPLFGSVGKIRVADVNAGKETVVGFADDHYFVRLPRGAFNVNGTLTLAENTALKVPGPVNTFEARLTGGRVVEGQTLTGLSDASLNLEIGRSGQQPSETGPTVFQLARAIRVTKSVDFEYNLQARSGADLGLIELPLSYGEKVLEVKGADGWRLEDGRLLLPAATRQADISITGTLPKLATFTPEARSNHEWWLIESDPEHRVVVESTGQQIELKASPIPSKLQTSRLYLLKAGQTLSAQSQLLQSAEVFAAILKGQTRTAVLTRNGDFVFEDQLNYENNGIDYLFLAPQGRPIYLETDGSAERIMHAEGKSREVMIPLQQGSHSARVQSLADFRIAPFGGRLEVPMPAHALTSSSTSVRLGLPSHIIPLAVLGGDRPDFKVDFGDLFAAVFGFTLGWLLWKRSRRGVVAGLLLGCSWFVFPPLYVAVLVGVAGWGAIWVTTRLLRGRKFTAGLVLAAVGAIMLGMILMSVTRSAYRANLSHQISDYETVSSRMPSKAMVVEQELDMAQSKALAGVIAGVTPVALPLPSYDKSVVIEQELVSKDRPFKPVVYYLTGWTVWPFIAAWALLLLWFVYVQRTQIRDRILKLRNQLDNLNTAPEPPPAASAP